LAVPPDAPALDFSRYSPDFQAVLEASVVLLHGFGNSKSSLPRARAIKTIG
jgi:hypothetical protein